MIQDFLVNLAASFVSIILVLWIERQRRPHLQFRVVPPIIVPPGDAARPECTWLGVEITNVPCPDWLSWVYTREPALSCRAFVTFHCTCGERLLPGEMPARWSGLVEPRIDTIPVPGGSVRYLRDAIPTVEIHANHSESVHPIVAFPLPFRTYGWTNESYVYGWQHPQWAVSHDQFVICIRVTTADREFTAAFRVDVTGSYAAMKIDQLEPEFVSRYANVA